MDPPAPKGDAARVNGALLDRLRTRSTRYHRPRAPFCGVGYCTNCLVRVNGVPNVRACRTPVSERARVKVENGWPTARFDLLGAFDVLFPRGIDTLRGFRSPSFATPIYQRVVRRLAGTGHLPTPSKPVAVEPGAVVEAPVVIVGGGIAGRATARILTVRGQRAVVLDRDATIPPVEVADTYLGTTAVFLPPPNRDRAHPFELVAARSDGPSLLVRADRVVVAVGGYDASLWFAGSDRPGVMTAEGAERLHAAARPGFSRSVVFGGGPRALEVLQRFPESVDAIVAPAAIDPELSRRASELDIPLYPRTLLLGALGRSRVRGVRLARRGGSTAPFDVEADAVILAHRRLPNPQLFFQAGAKMRWRPDVGAYGPVVGPSGETTVEGLYASGEVAGALTAESARASGARVADALVTAGPWPSPSVPDVIATHHELEGYYAELLGAGPRPGKTVACPCEDVLLPELLAATDEGYRGIEVVKRYTSLGTGLCQGRYCLPEALLVLGLREQRPVSEVGYITQRPPVVPTPLATLAGLPDPAPEAP